MTPQTARWIVNEKNRAMGALDNYASLIFDRIYDLIYLCAKSDE